MDIRYFNNASSEHTEIDLGNTCIITFTNVITKDSEGVMLENGVNIPNTSSNTKYMTIIQFIAGNGERKAIDVSNDNFFFYGRANGFSQEYINEISHMHINAESYLKSINMSLSDTDINVFAEYLDTIK